MKNWKEDYDLLTAFVLGEATPEMSRKLEKQMETDPELRAEVEEIRRMSDFLTDALAHEPFPENVEYPGVVILPPPEKAPKKRWSWLTRVTVCACALVLVVSGSLLFWPRPFATQIAQHLGLSGIQAQPFAINSEYWAKIHREPKIPAQDLDQRKEFPREEAAPLEVETQRVYAEAAPVEEAAAVPDWKIAPEPSGFLGVKATEKPAKKSKEPSVLFAIPPRKAEPNFREAPDAIMADEDEDFGAEYDEEMEEEKPEETEIVAGAKVFATPEAFVPEMAEAEMVEAIPAPVAEAPKAEEAPAPVSAVYAAEMADEDEDEDEDLDGAEYDEEIEEEEEDEPEETGGVAVAAVPAAETAPAPEAPVKVQMAPAAVAPPAKKVRVGGREVNGLGACPQMVIPRPEPPVRPFPPTPPVQPEPVPQPETPLDRNSYSMLEEQKFQKPEETPFSTFGVDVDSASYTLMRQYITERNTVPPKESVRVEEYINYFTYDLKGPAEDSDCPFETTVEIQKHPWRDGLYMAMVALKGREIPEEKRPKLNLVFLLDVSGSMSDWNKLPLVKDGMMKLLDQLKPEDRVSIVTYASGTEIKLEPTPGTEKRKIEKAILELNAYGSTNGGEGLQKAYALAKKNFEKDAENRVILCSDGDFNVGMTSNSELQTLVETEAKSGVFLTVLGFGMGNFQDDRMKALASHGNGVYGYVDSRAEAKKMLCDELSGSLVTIAKDVKLQIEFNPAKVAAYRLIGYETRHLEAKDFHDDRKDSGELGAGHSVVALYELVPVGGEIPQAERVDEPRYAPKEPEPEVKKEEAKPVNDSPEWFFVKLRWKQPDATESTLKTFPVEFHEQPVSANFQWATGTALYAMLLRESAYTGTANFGTVLEMIQPAVGDSSQRKEFVELVKKAQ